MGMVFATRFSRPNLQPGCYATRSSTRSAHAAAVPWVHGQPRSSWMRAYSGHWARPSWMRVCSIHWTRRARDGPGLHVKGVSSLVPESSVMLRAPGYAFTTWTNAFCELDALDVGDKIREHHLLYER